MAKVDVLAFLLFGWQENGQMITISLSTHHKAWRIFKLFIIPVGRMGYHYRLYGLGNWQLLLQNSRDTRINIALIFTCVIFWLNNFTFYHFLHMWYLSQLFFVCRKSFGHFFLSANRENASTSQSHSSSVQSFHDVFKFFLLWKKNSMVLDGA